jgi:hypothetical protein
VKDELRPGRGFMRCFVCRTTKSPKTNISIGNGGEGHSRTYCRQRKLLGNIDSSRKMFRIAMHLNSRQRSINLLSGKEILDIDFRFPIPLLQPLFRLGSLPFQSIQHTRVPRNKSCSERLRAHIFAICICENIRRNFFPLKS